MKIITGDEFGLIKQISTQSKQVIDQYGTIDSSKSILNIFTNKEIIENNNNSEINENDNEEDLNLFISSINENYILNWNNKKIISSYKNENENENKNISFISSVIKFNSSNNNSMFINGTSDDRIKIASFDKDNKYINTSVYWPWDNSNKFLKIKLRGLSNSIFNNNESVYCLYQNTPILLYNIEQQKVEFKGKNLPHDELGLKIPIHDTDVVEIKDNPRLNYVSTAYGEIRLYDKKASPKPSLNKQVTKSKINKIDITEDNNYLFVGDNQGYCAMLDIRKSFHPCKTFRGISASIKSLVNINKNNSLVVGGFDRYLRWYDYKSGNNDKIFLKNKINSILLIGYEPEKKIEIEDEDEEGEIDDSELEEGSEEDEENEEEEEYSEKEDENSEDKKNINKKNKKIKKEQEVNDKKENNVNDKLEKENKKDKKNKINEKNKNTKEEEDEDEEDLEEENEEEEIEEEKEDEEEKENEEEEEEKEEDEEENERYLYEEEEEEEEEEKEENAINKKRKRNKIIDKNKSDNLNKNKKKKLF